MSSMNPEEPARTTGASEPPGMVDAAQSAQPSRAADGSTSRAAPQSSGAADAAPIVSIRDVHKSFGDVEVLKGMSMDVPKGGVVCIIGPSGSGKSTLLRCINALLPIDRGSIRVAGFQVHTMKTDEEKLALRPEVSIVFQQYNLFPHKTAIENVMMAPIHVLREPRDEVRERAITLLKKVGLAAKQNSYPGELSGGQQQRVAIARALAMRPEVMLFDEITAALDPETVKEVLNTIRGLVAEGMTCMLVTHEMRFAFEVSTRVIFMNQGRIGEEGDPKEMFLRPKSERLAEFLKNSSFH